MRPDHAPGRAPARSTRLAGAAGALLMQCGFLLLFLMSMQKITPPVAASHELVFTLPRLTRPQPPPPQPLAPTRAPVRTALPRLRSCKHPHLPSRRRRRRAMPDLRNFGQALNGCAPEHYQSLTPEQKARCIRPGAGVAIQEFPNLMGTPSHVKDEAHWQEEWAREKSPALLPCGGFTNLLCLLTKIADGTLSDYGDPSKWPHYAVKQLAPEDFYKVEEAYDQWHKEHPEAGAQTASLPAGSAPEDAHGAR